MLTKSCTSARLMLRGVSSEDTESAIVQGYESNESETSIYTNNGNKVPILTVSLENSTCSRIKEFSIVPSEDKASTDVKTRVFCRARQVRHRSAGLGNTYSNTACLCLDKHDSERGESDVVELQQPCSRESSTPKQRLQTLSSLWSTRQTNIFAEVNPTDQAPQKIATSTRDMSKIMAQS